MFKVIKDIKINYKQYGNGHDLVLLHGWGQNIQMMEPLGNNLSANHKITIVDLPGFGLSDEPNTAYSVYDYVELLHELFIELNIEKPIIIGHSFGGRLAIIYSSKYDTEKIVLFGAPCVRHEVKSTKQKILKNLKKVKILNPVANIMKKYIGSTDYKNATPLMREVLVKTVNEDLSNCAKNIKCPALLIWGKNDEAVSCDEARELDELIPDSALIILEGSHYCYLENLSRVINILNNFI